MWWAPFLVGPVEGSVSLQNPLWQERRLGRQARSRKRRHRSTECAALCPDRRGRRVRALFRNVREDRPAVVPARGRVHHSAMMLAVDSATGGQRCIVVLPQGGCSRHQQQHGEEDEQHRSAHGPQPFHRSLPVRRHNYAPTCICCKSGAAARPDEGRIMEFPPG